MIVIRKLYKLFIEFKFNLLHIYIYIYIIWHRKLWIFKSLYIKNKNKKKSETCIFFVPVWIQLNPASGFSSSAFFFFFFFSFFSFFGTRNWRQRLLFIYYAWTVAENFDFSAIFSTLMGPVYCSRDPQTSLSSNIFIKNGSHNTIHTFKNYFATVFLVSAKIS